MPTLADAVSRYGQEAKSKLANPLKLATLSDRFFDWQQWPQTMRLAKCGQKSLHALSDLSRQSQHA